MTRRSRISGASFAWELRRPSRPGVAMPWLYFKACIVQLLLRRKAGARGESSVAELPWTPPPPPAGDPRKGMDLTVAESVNLDPGAVRLSRLIACIHRMHPVLFLALAAACESLPASQAQVTQAALCMSRCFQPWLWLL